MTASPRCVDAFPLNEINSKKSYKLRQEYDACMLIPYGRKGYVWFTYENGEEKSVLIEVNVKREIVKEKNILLSFCRMLSKGTILFGVIQNKNFIVEDILYYKGSNVMYSSYIKKIQIMNEFFKKELKNVEESEMNINIVNIVHTYEEALKIINKINYDIYSIKYIQMYSNSSLVRVTKDIPEFKKRSAVFWVRIAKGSELYELYVENKRASGKKFYGYACINDLYTSKLVENAFLPGEKSELKMECEYNKSVKGWVPKRYGINVERRQAIYIQDLRKTG